MVSDNPTIRSHRVDGKALLAAWIVVNHRQSPVITGVAAAPPKIVSDASRHVPDVNTSVDLHEKAAQVPLEMLWNAGGDDDHKHFLVSSFPILSVPVYLFTAARHQPVIVPIRQMRLEDLH